jgi:3-hydroxybutyryl-CoA dehydrogenase
MSPESPETRTRLGVVGAGTMGCGIALAALYARQPLVLFDISGKVLDQAVAYVRRHLARKGKLDWQDGLKTVRQLAALGECDFVIEAVPEDLDLKRRVFGDLQTVCSPDCVLATNTSTLSVTAIAAGLDQPQRAVGMHFFNPAAVLPLVEVVRASATADLTVQRAANLARRLGKTPVVVADTPGFIVNRLARPYYGEALKLLGEGAADVQTLDWILTYGAGFKMGPFRLMDLIGLDVNLAATNSVYERSGEQPRYRPHAIQQQMVLAGDLGRKTGRGFYDYGDEAVPPAPEFPEASQGQGPVLLSAGTWGPGVEALLTSRRLITRHPAKAQAGIVLAGRRQDLPAVVSAMDQSLPVDRPLLCQTADVTLHEVAQWVTHAERLVGFDGLFLAPGKVAALARRAATPPEICARAEHTMSALGKLPLWVDDPPGMISPRMLAVLVNEAAFAVEEGVAGEDGLDRAMVLGASYPRGPIAWGRRIGFEHILNVLDLLQRQFKDDRYRPAPWLRRQAGTMASDERSR